MLPSRAANEPLWAPLFTTLVVPLDAQPDRVPVSNPPLSTPMPPGPVTVRATVAMWLPLVAVPVTEIV